METSPHAKGTHVIRNFRVVFCKAEIHLKWSVFMLTHDMLFPGIKKYIVGLIIKTSSDPETMEREKVYLNKLNIILVQVS